MVYVVLGGSLFGCYLARRGVSLMLYGAVGVFWMDVIGPAGAFLEVTGPDGSSGGFCMARFNHYKKALGAPLIYP